MMGVVRSIKNCLEIEVRREFDRPAGLLRRSPDGRMSTVIRLLSRYEWPSLCHYITAVHVANEPEARSLSRGAGHAGDR
jgi:hypothetical protein